MTWPAWFATPSGTGWWKTSPDRDRALATGLACRPLEDTLRDTLDWLRTTPTAARSGLAREREAALLAEWRQRGAG